MALTPGTRLGVYEVTAQIGEGGMGQVYRARDTKLNRDVALKVLPDSFANDPDRLARFTREAQTLASLNHPNIAHIHGLEESSGVRALVMELVDGEDLSQRIARGAIPLDEALPIAKQIAEALEAAHEQGVIHRDLKPANIKIRPDGIVKVLDFGLAKVIAGEAAGVDLSRLPTVTIDGTREGVILGTAAYMSPEQARGQTLDKRTDVWAFGCSGRNHGQHLDGGVEAVTPTGSDQTRRLGRDSATAEHCLRAALVRGAEAPRADEMTVARESSPADTDLSPANHSPEVAQGRTICVARPSARVDQAVPWASMPMVSFTAYRSLCLHPRYRSVV